MRTHAALNRRSEKTMQPQHEATLRSRLAANPGDYAYQMPEEEDSERQGSKSLEEKQEEHKDDNEGHLGVEGKPLGDWRLDDLIRRGGLDDPEVSPSF